MVRQGRMCGGVVLHEPEPCDHESNGDREPSRDVEHQPGSLALGLRAILAAGLRWRYVPRSARRGFDKRRWRWRDRCRQGRPVLQRAVLELLDTHHLDAIQRRDLVEASKIGAGHLRVVSEQYDTPVLCSKPVSVNMHPTP